MNQAAAKARDWSTSRISALLMGASILGIAVLNFGPILRINDDVNAMLTMLIGLIFTLVHGSTYLGWKRLLVFLGVTIVISFSAEALGVATGLLFGKYHYTENLGPRLLGVPLLIQVAYVAMGYASFVTARVILSAFDTPRRWNLLSLTLGTALIMTAWDVAMDPYQSTIAGDWIWEEGGAYFGVPLHNYVGWYFTVAAFTFVYLLYEKSNPLPKAMGNSIGRLFFSAPVLYYGLIGLGIVITPVVETIETLASPQNYSGTLTALTHSLSLIAVFVMGAPAAMALVRLATDERSSHAHSANNRVSHRELNTFDSERLDAESSSDACPDDEPILVG